MSTHLPQPTSLNHLLACVRDAHAQARPLRIVGADTQQGYGRPCGGEPLTLQAHRGIVSHEPSELVVTVRAGTPLLELESALLEQGQALAFEPPRQSGASTVGGMLATGLAGPARIKAGGVRDHVLGIELIDGTGRLLRFGGTVMKNVAGYDVSRALVGSLGVLGVITEVSLKVLPRPAATQTLCFDLPLPAALAQLGRWRSQPWPIDASVWHRGQLLVRLAGSHAAVAHAVPGLGGSVLDPALATRHWCALRDRTLPFFTNPPHSQARLWRLSLPPTASLPPEWQTDALMEWHGAQRWVWSDAPAQSVHQTAAAAGGHAACMHAAATLAPHEEAFTRPADPLMQIQQRLKDAFDPQRLLNRGRLYTDL